MTLASMADWVGGKEWKMAGLCSVGRLPSRQGLALTVSVSWNKETIEEKASLLGVTFPCSVTPSLSKCDHGALQSDQCRSGTRRGR